MYVDRFLCQILPAGSCQMAYVTILHGVTELRLACMTFTATVGNLLAGLICITLTTDHMCDDVPW
jgi:hypothetical protein